MSSAAAPGPRFAVLRGEAYAALAASSFGSAFVATAIALRSFGPVPIAVWRTLLAALALWTVIAVQARRARRVQRRIDRDADAGAGRVRVEAPAPPLRGRLLRLGVMTILGGPVFLSAMNLSIAHVGPTIASFVAGLYAILTALFGPFLLRERLTARVVVAFVVALAGTALLAELDLVGSDAVGLAWGLIAATSYALYLVLTRRWSAANRIDGLVIAGCTTASTAIALGVALLLTDPRALFPATVAPEAVAALGWLAFVAGAGTVLVLASVRLIPAARSAVFLLLNPITATVLAGVLLGSVPTPVQLVGGLLVLLGMAAATLPDAVGPGPVALGPGPVADPSGRSAG